MSPLSKYMPRGEMTQEERAAAQRNAKRRRYLAQRGTPCRSTDIAKAQKNVRLLYYKHGMTAQAMSSRSGISRDTIMQLIHGYRVVEGQRVPVVCLLRSTLAKLEAIQPDKPLEEARAGSRLPPLGTRRRLQALNAMGYDCVWMSEQLGISAGNIGCLMLSKRGRRYVYAGTARRVAALYTRYQSTDPREVGRSAWQISNAKSRARKNGYAPPSCWDEDAIDSPHAEPEWTGACGTVEGYAIHRREKIPPCQPCRGAQRAKVEAAATDIRPDTGSSSTELLVLRRKDGRPAPAAVGHNRRHLSVVAA
ncbi:hypothetical protein [Streptomyces vinaceus]|uniref:hypothetical protein n=1 Tax=Streptomyces vinaceus TaxID=1960 RepID=UPI00381B69A5